jgi:transcriptional regulator with XRE-family HTH domain
MLNTKIIGNKIVEARKKMNISQAQLAQRLFISAQAVGKWERGESMPDITTFNRLAEILGVDLNYFSESFQPAVTGEIPVEPADKQSVVLPSEKEPQKLSWDMSRGNWLDADFSGLKNLNDTFSASNIQRCMFIGSDMSGLLLKSNHIDTCDFSGSDISSCHIQTSSLVNNTFKNCSFKETTFSESDVKECDFSDTDFTGVSFKSGAFVKNTITNVVWQHTSFIGMALDDIIFNGTLEDCYFENCGFKWVTFQNATLINTFFKNNRFKWIRLRFVDCQADRLTYQFLKSEKADLTGITLLTS